MLMARTAAAGAEGRLARLHEHIRPAPARAFRAGAHEAVADGQFFVDGFRRPPGSAGDGCRFRGPDVPADFAATADPHRAQHDLGRRGGRQFHVGPGGRGLAGQLHGDHGLFAHPQRPDLVPLAHLSQQEGHGHDHRRHRHEGQEEQGQGPSSTRPSARNVTARLSGKSLTASRWALMSSRTRPIVRCCEVYLNAMSVTTPARPQ